MHGAEIARYFERRAEPQFGPPPRRMHPWTKPQMIAKLAPAIGLRRQLDPRAATKPAKYSDQILTIRPLQPAERAFSDETLDTIMVEHEANRWHEHPAGLLVASGSVPCVDLVSR